jgi:tol-pal system protein YbgF
MSEMKLRFSAGIVVVLLGLGGCATTPPSEDPVLIKLTEIDDRLRKVERLADNESLVELAGQIADIQREIREIRGDVETLRYESEGAATRQRDQYLDIDRRLQTLEGTAPPVTASAGAASGFGAGAATAAGGAAVAAPAAGGAAERASYQAAFDLLKEGRYEQARAGFEKFLAEYPGSDLAGHSQYWLGETYYVTQKYDEALAAFQKAVSQYPQSRKLPDALLKVGYCRYELGQYAEARAALNSVLERFPESTAARLAGQRLDRMQSEGR